MAFVKAVRKQARLRLALTGPSGSGKTYGALMIAKGIGGRIAVIDTEKGSASLYSHLTEFDVLELEPLIIDSTTPEWSGVGGCLELVDEIARARYKGNSWSAWNDVTPRHRAFLDAILRSPLHVIATMRSKTETAQTEENGRKRVVKLGMKSEQRDGIEYEFTTVLDIVHDGHYAIASKDRTGLFTDQDPHQISEKTGAMLLEWLESGETVTEPVQGMTASELADWQSSIEAAATIDDLKNIYGNAVILARNRNDKMSYDALTATKNARKKTLEGVAA